MTTTTASHYRRPLLDPGDALFLRCLASCAIAAVAFVALVRLVPAPPPKPVTQVEQLPQRFAKLILEPKRAAPPPPAPIAERARAAAPPAAAGGGGGGEAAPAPVAKPAPAAGAPAGNRRVESMHALPGGGGGTAGAARARAEVGAQLAGTTSSLKSALAGLNASLGTTSSATGGTVARGGRARAVRGAAGVAELDRVSSSLATGAGVGVGGASGGDLTGSAVAGSLVSIGELSSGGGGAGGGGGLGSGGGTGGGTGTGSGTGTGPGSGPGVGAPGAAAHRSNASLLAVIQRYAPGIQYCYGNELKREPTLRGKLVLALTVAASGEVSDARVVQNTTGSQALASCALAQVRDWRFPAVTGGATTFQAPFVFTPPQ